MVSSILCSFQASAREDPLWYKPVISLPGENQPRSRASFTREEKKRRGRGRQIKGARDRRTESTRRSKEERRRAYRVKEDRGRDRRTQSGGSDSGRRREKSKREEGKERTDRERETRPREGAVGIYKDVRDNADGDRGARQGVRPAAEDARQVHGVPGVRLQVLPAALHEVLQPDDPRAQPQDRRDLHLRGLRKVLQAAGQSQAAQVRHSSPFFLWFFVPFFHPPRSHLHLVFNFRPSWLLHGSIVAIDRWGTL